MSTTESSSYDISKAREFFIHCVTSSMKFSHREMSKRELLSKIKTLSHFSVDRTFRHHLGELEGHVNDLLKKERKILTLAKAQKEQGQSIQDRINTLEEKLSRYVEQRSIHEVKLKALETKVTARMKRRQIIHELKQHIRAIEDLYDEISQERYQYDSAKIKKVEARLQSLKVQLHDIEQKQA